MDPLFDFSGKVALVTGGSRGLGYEMVKALAAKLKAAGRPQTAQIMHDIIDYHATPAQAAALKRAESGR